MTAPPDFAARLAARLPRRHPARGRRLALAAAVVLLLLLAGSLVQPTARAAVGLFLRQVILHESAPPPELLGLLPLTQVSLDEAQRLAGWPILQPGSLPEGYRLVGVYAGQLHAFASGPTIVLHYQQGDGSAAQHLGVTEPGRPRTSTSRSSGRRPPDLGWRGSGLFIDGRWIERDGQRFWERGRLVWLIVEQACLVIQLQADPRDGWDADRLAEVAAALRE